MPLVQSEHALSGVIFEKYMANQIHKYLIPPVLTIFTATGTAVNASLKKTLTMNATSVGIAYTCYTELTTPSRIDTFEDWIRSKAGRKENELVQLSHTFRASCLRALPEFLEETRAFGTKPANTQDQNFAGISATTVNVSLQWNAESYVLQSSDAYVIGWLCRCLLQTPCAGRQLRPTALRFPRYY